MDRTVPRTQTRCAFTTACIWEVDRPKVGNVHRTATFADVDYRRFLLCSGAIAVSLECSIAQLDGTRRRASIVRHAVSETRMRSSGRTRISASSCCSRRSPLRRLSRIRATATDFDERSRSV